MAAWPLPGEALECSAVVHTLPVPMILRPMLVFTSLLVLACYDYCSLSSFSGLVITHIYITCIFFATAQRL